MWLFYSAAVFLYGVAFARAWTETTAQGEVATLTSR